MSSAVQSYLSQWDSVLRNEDGSLILDEQSENHTVLSSSWLARTIQLANAATAGIGDLGMEFNAAAEALSVPEHIRLDKQKWGASISAFRFGAGYDAEMVFGPQALTGPYEFLASRYHEYIHGLQMMNAPVLHASPANPVGRFIFLPTDYIKMRELMELDAYAKQGWLTLAFLKAHGLEHHAATDWAVDFYRDIQAQHPDMNSREIMMSVAATLLHNTKLPQTNEPLMSLYHEQAITDYERAIQSWKLRHPDFQAPEAIRVTGADMMTAGNSFGPNIFRHPSQDAMLEMFARPSNFTADHLERIANIHDVLGLDEQTVDNIDTFAQALDDASMTADDFLRESLAGVKGVEKKTAGQNIPKPRP